MTRPVHVFQLASGCCVIGQIVSTNKDHIVIDHPLELRPQPTKTGFVFSAQRWLPFNHNTFRAKIYKRNIVGSSDTDSEISDYYNEQVTKLTIDQTAEENYDDDLFDSTFH